MRGLNMAKSNIKVTLNADIKKVWNTILDLKNYSWRSDIEKIEIIDENKFIEYTKDGFKTIFITTLIEPYKRWEFDIENENIKGHWVGIFYKCNDKTTIDFTENIKVKKWYLKPFISSYLRNQQNKYYIDLKRELDNKFI